MTQPNTLAPVISVDGPSGVGKGAVCSALANILGWHVLDSGAVYRALALAASEAGIAADDESALVRLCDTIDLSFEAGDQGISVLVNGEVVDDRLRSEPVSQMASKVAALGPVRQALLALQQSFRKPPGLIADGRDMGTVVFPEAVVKIFLIASADERAKRRYKQLKDKGEDVIFARLLSDIAERDKRDRERSVSPTVPAADATVIDSTSMSLDEVIQQSVELIKAKGFLD